MVKRTKRRRIKKGLGGVQTKIKRGPQVILPKDAALILAYSGVKPGAKVVDAGTGSGSLAIFLATYLQPGRVYTYEKDKRFVALAKENIKNSGVSKYIRLREADVTKGIKEKKVDLVTFDLKDANKAIGHAHNALKQGGTLMVYSPTADHLLESVKAIKKKFKAVRTIEGIVREWKSEYTTRPETIGLMHTGFLTFTKKTK
jgi:tRNA (adenine57-N1/adenine58-N1)-methyltransferase